MVVLLQRGGAERGPDHRHQDPQELVTRSPLHAVPPLAEPRQHHAPRHDPKPRGISSSSPPPLLWWRGHGGRAEVVR
jgi:hypothetical protein